MLDETIDANSALDAKKISMLDAVNTFEKFDGWTLDTPQEKMTWLAKAAVSIAADDFPLLNPATWAVLLDTMQSMYYNPGATMRMVLESHQINHLGGYVRDGYPECTLHASGVNIEDIDALTKTQILSVCLIAEKFWTDGNHNMRLLLSSASGRPMESVYSDDPDPCDIWTVESVQELHNGDVKVEFSYGDEIGTHCVISRESDGSYAARMPYWSGRAVCLPSETLGQILYKKAFAAVDEVFGD